jgi:hypothetical protein
VESIFSLPEAPLLLPLTLSLRLSQFVCLEGSSDPLFVRRDNEDESERLLSYTYVPESGPKREKNIPRKSCTRKKGIECADSGFFGSISKKEGKKTRGLLFASES